MGWDFELEFGISYREGKLTVVCTLALYFHAEEFYPLIVAANRDERHDRPTAVPALLEGSPRILAGRDLRAGGTWLGVNEYGLMAAVLNRKSADTAPSSEKRSRGLLCLDLLRCRSAGEAHAFLSAHRESYEPFTLVFADLSEAWSAVNSTEGIVCEQLAPGLHVFGNGPNGEWSEKTQRAYTLFHQAAQRSGLRSEPSAWIGEFARALGDHAPANGSNDPRDAICVHGDGAGTVSSSIIVYSEPERSFRNFYCDGAPCRTPFRDVLSLPVT